MKSGDEGDHAFAAGYEGTRAVRTWRERVKIVEQNGFIKTAPIGNRIIGAVLLVHPSVVLEELKKAEKISQKWWNAYVSRRTATGEDGMSSATAVGATVLRLPGR